MKILELYNQILESKRTEAGAIKIIQTYYKLYDEDYNKMPGGMHKTERFRILEDPDVIIDQLKSIDTSENQNNLEAMAYLLCLQLAPRLDVPEISMDHMSSTFEDYNDLLGRQKIKPIQISKKGGLKIEDNTFGSFLSFQEYIHGQKNLYGQKDKRSGELVVNIEDKPVFDKNGIEIYDAFEVGRCIKYGYTSQIQKGLKPYSFCISDPKMKNNMWQSYRDTKGSTFYFIFDKNRDAEDPLHMVVFDNTSRRGVELTDADNRTGNVAEYGSDSEGYINYLESKGVSARDLMPNREYSDAEREESNLLRHKNEDLKWFMDLPLEYKEKYIGRGHKLTTDQFKYISPNGDLVSKYIQLGHMLEEGQFASISSNQTKTYLRARMNMITHWFEVDDDYDRRHGLDEYRFRRFEISKVPDSIRVDYVIKLAEFIPLKNYEFSYIPDDKKMVVKKGSYIRDAKKDTVKNMVKDAEFPNEERWSVTKLYMETRLSRGKQTEVESEVLNYLTDDQQNLIMAQMLENGMVYTHEWETKIPKRFLKVYIEMIGEQGGTSPMLEELPQALIDLYIKTMGDNNNRMNPDDDIRLGSQDARDYYLLKGLEQAHPSTDGIHITSKVFSYGSDKVKQFYYKRYDKRLGHMTRTNVKAGNSPYHKVSVEDIEFASPHFREEWYMAQLDRYDAVLKHTAEGISNIKLNDAYVSHAVEEIVGGMYMYGDQTMDDTSDEFRREVFGRLINMTKGSLGEFISKGFNTNSFRNFVERYCPKDMVRSFIELIPKDSSYNTWVDSDYLSDNNV